MVVCADNTVERKFMLPQLGTCVKVLKAIRENKFHTVGKGVHEINQLRLT